MAAAQANSSLKGSRGDPRCEPSLLMEEIGTTHGSRRGTAAAGLQHRVVCVARQRVRRRLVNNRHYPRGIATTVPVKRPPKPLALFRQRGNAEAADPARQTYELVAAARANSSQGGGSGRIRRDLPAHGMGWAWLTPCRSLADHISGSASRSSVQMPSAYVWTNFGPCPIRLTYR